MTLGTSSIITAIEHRQIRYTVLPECADYHQFRCQGVHIDLQVGHHVWYHRNWPGVFSLNAGDPTTIYRYVDAREEQQHTVDGIARTMPPGTILIPPGVVMLMHSVQAVGSSVPHLSTTLDGRSTFGRLGLHAHLNAGHGEPGFDWVWTFEVLNNTRTLYTLDVGSYIASILFEEVQGEVVMYPKEGRYQTRSILDWTPAAMLPRMGNL